MWAARCHEAQIIYAAFGWCAWRDEACTYWYVRTSAAGRDGGVPWPTERRCILECHVQENLCIFIPLERGHMSEYSVLSYNSVPIRRVHPTLNPLESQVLLFWTLSLQHTLLVCLLWLLVSNGQQMHLASGVTALCLHDATFCDRGTACRITLFSAVLAITSLVIGHIVGFVGVEELDHVSS